MSKNEVDMNFIKNFAKKLVISIFNTAFTIFILYWNVMTIINAIQSPDANWNQVFTYLACSVLVLIIMWFMAFLRFLRNLVIFILILLLIGWCSLPKFLPEINEGMCVTIGSCKEGSEVKTVSGKIIINRQSCTENGWKWNDNKNTCLTKIKQDN